MLEAGLQEEGYFGSSNSAALLKQFVPNYHFDKEEEQIPWIHLDIAGTACGPGGKAKSEASNPFIPNMEHQGGVHVKTLYRMITENDYTVHFLHQNPLLQSLPPYSVIGFLLRI